jgi:hypothetical protein
MKLTTMPPRVRASHDVMDMIRHLSDLRGIGVLSDEGFSTRKAELLACL